MNRKNKKEASMTGAVANYSGGGLGVTSDLSPKHTKQRNMARKKMNKLGKQKDKHFKQLENKKISDEALREYIKDQMFEMIIEQNDPKEVINLMDNISKMIGLSLTYVRMFLSDGMKMGDHALDYHMKRAKAEISRIQKLVQDVDKMTVNVYDCHRKGQEQLEMDKQSQDDEYAELNVIPDEKKDQEECGPGDMKQGIRQAPRRRGI